MRDTKQFLIVPVAIAVLLVWTASAIYSFISGQYAPLTVSTPVMLVLAGYVFGFKQVVKTATGNGGRHE